MDMSKKKCIFVFVPIKERYGRTKTDPFSTVFLLCFGTYKHGGFTDAKHVGCFCSQLNMSTNLLRLNRLTLHIEISFVSYCPGNCK